MYQDDGNQMCKTQSDNDEVESSKKIKLTVPNGKVSHETNSTIANHDMDRMIAVNHTNGSIGDGYIYDSVTGVKFDKKEYIKLTLQSLKNLGYNSTATALAQESGITQNNRHQIYTYENVIMEGKWDIAINSITDVGIEDVVAVRQAKELIYKQMYYELISEGDLSAAVQLLQTYLTPILQTKDDDLQDSLNDLVRCMLPNQCMNIPSTSRDQLFREIIALAPPSSLLLHDSPRMFTLIGQACKYQALQAKNKALTLTECYVPPSLNVPSLLVDVNEKEMNKTLATKTNIECVYTITKHTSEVWYTAFSHDGTRLATCGKGGQVYIFYIMHSSNTLVVDESSIIEVDVTDGHRDVSIVKWSPDDEKIMIVSSNECRNSSEVSIYNSNDGTLMQTSSIPDCEAVSVEWFPDSINYIRGGVNCHITQCSLESPSNVKDVCTDICIVDLCLSADGRRIFVASSTREIWALDAATLTNKTLLLNTSRLVVSLGLSDDKSCLIVQTKSSLLQVFDIERACVVASFKGMKNDDYILRPCMSKDYIFCGSEDSKLYIWKLEDSNTPMYVLNGHAGVVNCVSWNCVVRRDGGRMFCTASDDSTVRIYVMN